MCCDCSQVTQVVSEVDLSYQKPEALTAIGSWNSQRQCARNGRPTNWWSQPSRHGESPISNAIVEALDPNFLEFSVAWDSIIIIFNLSHFESWLVSVSLGNRSSEAWTRISLPCHEEQRKRINNESYQSASSSTILIITERLIFQKPKQRCP